MSALAAQEEGSGQPVANALTSPTPAATPSPTAGREDYDELISFSGLEPGEPYLFIRGRDVLSAPMAEAYAWQAQRAGAHPAALESMLKLRDRLEAWPEKRLVALSHLKDSERAQLAYEYSQRAWRHEEDSADLAVMYAEDRAMHRAFSRMRPLLQALFEGGTWADDGTFVFDPQSLVRGEPRERIAPTPCPITGLHRFYVTLGREPEVPSRSDLLTRAIDCLRTLLQLKRLKAQDGESHPSYQRRKPLAWAQAQAIISEAKDV